MAMFLGKILSERNSYPQKISNSLPSWVTYESGKYFFRTENKDMKPVEAKEASFKDFFGIESEDIDETAEKTA